MTKQEQLILQDVRCFDGEQRGNVRPITLLVGENSTGKSTFLACFSVFHQTLHSFLSRNEAPLDFNQEPFSMGSFRDIVRSRQGRTGRINEFKLGIKIDDPKKTKKELPTEIVSTFEEGGSQPVPKSCLYRFGYKDKDFINIQCSENDDNVIVTIPDREIQLDIKNNTIHPFIFNYRIFADEWFTRNNPDAEPICSYMRELLNFENSDKKNYLFSHRLRRMALLNSRIVPVSPLRAKPKRTYDPVSEASSPGGEHIPMLMMRLDHVEKKLWKSLHDELVEFGKDSGLFYDIKVRRHGKQIHDPFQLQVKVQSGTYSNIMDVGYGVSQSLPILVELLSKYGQKPNNLGQENTFLLQQPEVHLHPRGQAELSNLFAKVVKKRPGHNRFMIETHSDYIIDRIRILVRKGELKSEDVSIIFFEPKKNKVEMHNITLDKDGNIENAPASYRSFFLRETDSLLGFED